MNDYQGKTLTMLALILATKKESDSGFSKTTLIGKQMLSSFLGLHSHIDSSL